MCLARMRLPSRARFHSLIQFAEFFLCRFVCLQVPASPVPNDTT